ncbi:MAG: cytochrome c oxidase assembly protein, partial [Thermoanaerobaculia bacterium]
MPLDIVAHAPLLVPPDRLWTSWSFEPLVIASLLLAAFLYARGVRRLWTRAGRGEGISYARVLSFSAGELALAVALVSPLDTLGGTLLSAHMAQHGVLAGIAPPLLMLGRPGVAFAWGITPLWRIRSLGRIVHALSTPMRAAVLLGVTLWVWHAPALFNAAVTYEWIHALQHLCFVVPALLFWQAVLDDRHRTAASFAAAFFTFMHSGLLGGLLTMAPEPLYVAYFGHTELWGMTALQDQQLAGVLMWVPMGLPYLAAGLVLASRFVRVDPAWRS